ncbi:MAG TPA: undecaprenyl-phosphate glucose phosphotransferase [Chitinophagaceae bacterium]|nr:undecaprenyl-phosphate glucose phosphotransferase [Chitinophagaceae bacterium]
MNQRLATLLRISFVILDILVLNLVFVICQYVFRENIALNKFQYTYLWFFSNAAWVAASWATSIYKDSYIYSFEKFSKRTMNAFLYLLALEMVYLFFNKDAQISRLFLISILSSFAISLLINRFLHLALQQFFQNKDHIVRKVMIIGYNERAKKLASYLEQEPIKTEIVGFCEEEENVNELSRYPIVGAIGDAIQASKEREVTEIFSTIAPEQLSGIYKLINEADQACIRFRIVPDFNHFIRKPVHLDYLKDIPVLSLRKEPLDDVGNRIKKRLYDLAISSLVTIFILSWLIPIVSLLIWLDSRGPIFFIQQRSGKNGKTFNCIKFRSMKVNKESNEKQATKNDKRITMLGSFLRKSNLDEMPQFINVLMSDMSIVGPRPHMLKHTDDYSKLLNRYMVRHFLKPGITGWAQIHGYRGEIKHMQDINNRVEYDLWYLENWSVWLDTRIILMTAFNMAKGEKNAY